MTLVLDLPLQETTGNPVDHSALPHTLSFASDSMQTYTTYGPGGELVRGALTCNTAITDGWLAIGESLTLSSPITLPGEFGITWWMRLDNLYFPGYVFTEDVNAPMGTSFIELIPDVNSVSVNDGSVNLSFPASFNANSGWNFFSVTRGSNNKIRLRVNGGPEISPFVDSSATEAFVIAVIGSGEEGSALGAISGIRVYNAEPSEEVIQADYERGLPLNTTVIDLPMQDEGVTLVDTAGHLWAAMLDQHLDHYRTAGPGGQLTYGVNIYYGLSTWRQLAEACNLAHALVFPAEFAVSVFLKIQNLADGDYLVCEDRNSDGYAITIGIVSGAAALYVNRPATAPIVFNIPSPIGWHHYCVYRNYLNQFKLRIDAGSEIAPIEAPWGAGEFRVDSIGNGDASDKFISLCGFKVYTGLVSIYDIQADYERGLPLSHLVMDLPLQETAGNPIDSASSNELPFQTDKNMQDFTTYGPGGELTRGMLTCKRDFSDPWSGGDEALYLTSATVLPGEFCITAWFRIRQSSTYICSDVNDFTSFIELNSSSVLVGCNYSAAYFLNAYNLDYIGWVFLCITRDSDNKIRVKVNGGPELVPTVDAALSGDFKIEQIGRGEEGAAFGALAGIRVYDTKPSAEVIQADYERGLPLNHLILDLPCQDDIAGGPSEQEVTDASYGARELFTDEGSTNNYSITGPGKNYPKAFLGPNDAPSYLRILFPDEFWIPPTGSFTVSAIERLHENGCALFSVLGALDEVDISILPNGTAQISTLDKTHNYIGALGDLGTTDWHHYAVVFKSNGDIAFYVDAELKLTASGHRMTETFKVYGITSNPGGTVSSLCGFKLYDTELTISQIRADARLVGIFSPAVAASNQAPLFFAMGMK